MHYIVIVRRLLILETFFDETKKKDPKFPQSFRGLFRKLCQISMIEFFEKIVFEFLRK